MNPGVIFTRKELRNLLLNYDSWEDVPGILSFPKSSHINRYYPLDESGTLRFVLGYILGSLAFGVGSAVFLVA